MMRRLACPARYESRHRVDQGWKGFLAYSFNGIEDSSMFR